MLGRDVHGRPLTDHDREEHRREQREKHHETMTYQSAVHPFQTMAITPTRTAHLAAARPVGGYDTRQVGIHVRMNLRPLILLVGAIALIAGVIALLAPVSIPGPNGRSIGCGNGIAVDTSASRQADNSNPVNLPILNEIVPHTDYVTQCQSAVSSRRASAIPVAVIGLVVAAGSFFVGGRAASVRGG
jgi:hypothetical protein